MAQFTSLTSRVVALSVNDIDTDQIIPARFLKATDKVGYILRFETEIAAFEARS